MKQGIHAGIGLVLVAAACAAAACGDEDSLSNVTAADAGTDAPVSALCPDGKPVDYPPGPYVLKVGQTLPPDLEFQGAAGAVKLKDYFDPCAAKPKLLVVRTSAAWCGTCLWSVGHTKRLFEDARFEGRVALLDLLVADEDNLPATVPALGRWLAKIDAPGKIAIDTKYTLAPILLARAPLPEYVFVDTRTMSIRGAFGMSAPELVQNKILIELAMMDGLPRPDAVAPALYDGTLTEDAADMLRDMKPAAAPVDPTNEYGDDAAAVVLGKKLFADNGLSPQGVSCAKCHDEGFTFTDRAAQSTGVSKVDRNAPSVVASSSARWQFWDGRADTLWAQALGPPENPKEIGSTRLYIAHQIAQRYAAEYGAIFGAKYPLPANLASLPADGKPGDAAYDAMAQADKDAVTRIYVNVGKAMAAFERSIKLLPNALDKYAAGTVTALQPDEKKGLAAYFTAGCAQCHWGPNLTDEAFHALRFPTGRQDGQPDKGRIDVMTKLAAGEFAATTKWSDAPTAAKNLVLASEPSMLGAFKTPSLRGIATTAPYGHGGTFTTLADVTKHYGTRAKDVGDDKAVGVVEAWVPEFDVNAQTDLARFLDVLRADLQP